MGPGANNAIGSVGGVLLAACLIPQLVRMFRTKSAYDLSYIFVMLYISGLVLTAVYLIYENALVGWITAVIEAALACVMCLGKIYLDTWGPNAYRTKSSLHGESRLSSPIRIEPCDNLENLLGGGFPFQHFMGKDCSHGVVHLLADCQLIMRQDFEQGHRVGSALHGAATIRENVSGQTSLQNLELGNIDSTLLLESFVPLIEMGLRAAGLIPHDGYIHMLPLRAQGESSNYNESNREESLAPDSCILFCKVGYVTAIWSQASSLLMVDFVGASTATIKAMSCAAIRCCRELLRQHPEAKINLSSLSRSPGAQL